MHKTLLPIVVLAALALPASALAASQPFTARAEMRLVKTYPDGRYLLRGPISSRGLGHGTATYLAKLDGTTVTSTVKARFDAGEIDAALSGTYVTSAPNSNLVGTTSGKGRITRTTGAYSGARGAFAYKGISTADGNTVLVLRGRFSPPTG